MAIPPPLRRSFRLVCAPEQVALVENLLQAQGFDFEPEPFSPLARRLVTEPFPLGRSLAAFWGFIYIQDRSSMLPPLALAPQEGDCVLDMCASPGSKTGLLAQLVGKHGLVLGNEPSKARLGNLRRNLATMNLLQTVTCSWSGESLPLPDAVWDTILLDPPCSGWGTIDRNPQVMKLWHGDKVNPLITLQRKLLAEATRLLRPGGRLVYSTCTTNQDENEAQVQFAMEELGLELVPLEPFAGFTFVEPYLASCAHTLRVDEEASEAQGFYIACLRRPESAVGEGLSVDTSCVLPASCQAVAPELFAQTAGIDPDLLPAGQVTCCEDTLRFLPAPALARLPASLRWQGYPLGRCAGRSLVPSSRVRVLFGQEPALPRLNIDDTKVLESLLQGQSLQTGRTGKEAALFWRDLPLGRITLKNGRALWSER